MPGEAVTLAEMQAERWIITAHCPTCRTRLHVNLLALIQLVGPTYVLWGKHPRCKVWTYSSDARCEGRVTFAAQSVQNGSFRLLTMSGEVRSAIELRSQQTAYGR